MATAAILGASGYSGQETLDRLLRHPELEVLALGSDSLAGQAAGVLGCAAAELAVRLRGRPCLVIGSGAAALAAELGAAGIDAMAEEALPDPIVVAHLAADDGAAAWRARNAREGLPRPLYLRGVNITLPDGGRRTVE